MEQRHRDEEDDEGAPLEEVADRQRLGLAGASVKALGAAGEVVVDLAGADQRDDGGAGGGEGADEIEDPVVAEPLPERAGEDRASTSKCLSLRRGSPKGVRPARSTAALVAAGSISARSSCGLPGAMATASPPLGVIDVRTHLDHRHHQPRFRRMAQCLRRRQDDYRAARSPHPSLRYRRDRQRELALRASRPTPRGGTALAPSAQPRPAPPGQALPHHPRARGVNIGRR